MKRVLQKFRNFLCWYGAKWTHPLAFFLLLTAFLALSNVLSVFATRFCKLIIVAAILQFGHLVFAGIAGVMLLFRKKLGRAFAYWLECGVFVCITGFVMFAGMLAYGLADNDHFADNLQLPKDLVLSEPISGGCEWGWGEKNVTDAFQKQVIGAIGTGPTLKRTDECHIPALERLMATPSGKQKVLDYLAASSDWTLWYNKADRLYATRNSRYTSGLIDSRINHALFPATNVQTGKKEGIHSQYSFRIYFDGLPNRLFAKGKKITSASSEIRN